MRKNITREEDRKRRKLFEEFCKNACPKYAGQLSKISFETVMRNLADGSDLVILCNQAKRFKKENPEGICSSEILPKPTTGKTNCIYNERAAVLIRQKTGIGLHVSSQIPKKFYFAVFNECLKINPSY